MSFQDLLQFRFRTTEDITELETGFRAYARVEEVYHHELNYGLDAQQIILLEKRMKDEAARQIMNQLGNALQKEDRILVFGKPAPILAREIMEIVNNNKGVCEDWLIENTIRDYLRIEGKARLW